MSDDHLPASKFMLTTQAAISRTRRDLVLAIVLKALLAVGILASLLVKPPLLEFISLMGVIGGWVAVSIASAKGSRLMAGSSSLIAAGQFDEAEKQIDDAIRSFSIFRAAKLQTLHHLALLRHAQRRWQESALLCQALLGQRLGAARGLSKPSQLLLSDSLLEMNDLNGARDAIGGLYQQRLSLAELLHLLLVQLDYSSRVGEWEQMMRQVADKVQLVELMPSQSAARAQGLLALAGRKVGREDWARWLRSRAELLCDVTRLIAERPVLAEMWAEERPASDAS